MKRGFFSIALFAFAFCVILVAETRAEIGGRARFPCECDRTPIYDLADELNELPRFLVRNQFGELWRIGDFTFQAVGCPTNNQCQPCFWIETRSGVQIPATCTIFKTYQPRE